MTDHSSTHFPLLTARLAVLVAAAALAACDVYDYDSGGGSSAERFDRCSVADQNEIVMGAMSFGSLWFDQVPQVNPADFGSPEALLECLAGRTPDCQGFRDEDTPDDRFSYIISESDPEEDELFRRLGWFTGLGLRSQSVAPDIITVTDVFERSPASSAGLARGQRIIDINGVPAEQVIRNGGVETATGPNVAGTLVTLLIEEQDGSRFEVSVEKAEFDVRTVSAIRIFDVAGRKTGYFHLRAFVDNTDGDLFLAAQEFREAGVEDVVVDLRYNAGGPDYSAGGLGRSAVSLANVLVGARADGELFSTTDFGDGSVLAPWVTSFRDPGNSIETQRVVFITSEATASTSEMAMNGLKPYVEVKVVGATTFGEAVETSRSAFCGKVLWYADATVANAEGNADFFDGLSVDCAAEDDTTAQLGDPAEASLAEALYLLENGVCSVASEELALERSQRTPPGPRRQRFDAW